MLPTKFPAEDHLVIELGSLKAKLREAEQLIALATNIGALGVWHYDIARDVMACDDRWYEIVGCDPADMRVNTMEKWGQIVHPDDRATVTEVNHTARALLDSKQAYNIQFRIVRPDGEIRWVRSSAHIVEDEFGAPGRAVGFMADITEWWRSIQSENDRNISLREQVQLSRRHSMIDPLTGIANKLRFDIELRRACAHAIEARSTLTLAMVRVANLDELVQQSSAVNANKLLAALAEIVASAAWRPYDFVARYSESTIAILMPETTMPEVVMNRIAENSKDLTIPSGPLHVIAAHHSAAQALDLTPSVMIRACEQAVSGDNEEAPVTAKGVSTR